MNPEELATFQLNAVSDKIWENFLMAPDKATTYEFQEPDERKFIPNKATQFGIIKKIEKNWRGISNIKQSGDYLNFDVHKEAFKKFRKAFKNPKASFQTYKLSKINSILLPEGTNWEHVMIKFLDRHNIEIKLRNDKAFRVVGNFKDFGLENERKLVPNLQWLFLELLAKRNGRITWEDSEASQTRRKQKELLAKSLKAYFQIDEDPFLNYRKEHAYELKFTIR